MEYNDHIKILAIGDFHGKIPDKLFLKIKKEKFDLILSTGDFCGNEELRRLMFKHYNSDKTLEYHIGKRKLLELDKKRYLSGVEVLNKLKKFGKPLIVITGNWDPSNYPEIGYPGIKDNYTKRFFSILKKLKVNIIDFKNINFNGINIVGYPKSSYPGIVDKEREKMLVEKYGKKASIIIKKTKQDNKKYFRLFKMKFEDDSIFLSHNCLYRTKLDIIKKGPRKNMHYGSFLSKEIVKKLKPRLVICGHIHEGIGKCRVGKTLIVNPGAAVEGRAAMIEYPLIGKGKIGVKFIRV
jgi:Icc-related predicted phosphoesterase